jgi:pimeloyl-ACP methyl ester carboxylesterase
MDAGARDRRRVLAGVLALAGSIGLAGCFGDGSGADADGDPEATPTTETAVPTESTETTETATTTATETTATTETTESPRTVSFEAPHGATIEATAYGSGDCGVILVPQINLDRGSWKPQAEMIAKMGHLALAIDEDPDDRPASVRGAVQYIRTERSVSTVVLVGASSGGEAVVVANAEMDAPVAGTVAISAGGGADRASDLRGRTLFVVSEGDDDRFVRVATELHEGAPDPTKLVTYDGSAHGQAIFDSEHGDDLRERLRAFVSAVCSN